MIPKSKAYKLVNDKGIIIAEGSKKEMLKLLKKNSGSRIWLTDKKIGESVNETRKSS